MTINSKIQLICVAVLLVVASSASCWGALVFSALHHGSWKVYFHMDITSPPKLVTEIITGDENAPVLTRDKQRVAFEVQGTGIYICPINSLSVCEVIRPPHGSAVRPAWHATTSELIFVNYVFSSGHEDSDILTTRGGLVETGPLLTQTGNQDYPDVSPDGRLLAYSSGLTVSFHRSAVQVVQQIWIMSLETGRAHHLILSNAQDIHPDWSPSEQELAFASDRTEQFEIWVVHADGSGLRQVTSGPGAKTWPAWSPDGKSIMFTLTKEGRQSLWLIDVDGLNLRPFEPFGPNADVELRDADWR